VFENLSKLKKADPPVYGLEYLFDFFLLVLRYLSVSYWMRFPFERQGSVRWRNNAVDAWCCVELVVLLVLLARSNNCILNTGVCIYVLFEIYLSLFNIVFVGKFRDINYPSPSIERVILLMFLNVLHVVCVFAVLYRTWSATTMSWQHALSQAVRVLGTVEAPAQPALWVDLQILFDLLLLVIFLASFVGQVGVFRAPSGSQTKSQH
jgi:hypothetical protein